MKFFEVAGVLFLIGMIFLASAEPDWNYSSNDNPYFFLEDSVSYYNFTSNLSDVSDLSGFSILNISWAQGVLGPSHSDFYWMPWNDSGFSNSVSGIFKLGAVSDNETGKFDINVHAQGNESGKSLKFEFIINATNDDPNFTLGSFYNVSVPIGENVTKNISLIGSDEEGQYPLSYNVSFLNCSFALWSSRNNSDCSLDYEFVQLSNTSSVLAFSNLSYNDIGEYNLSICVWDNVNGGSLPLYYDSGYLENKSVCKNTTLNLLSTLSIDASNCSGSVVMEDETLNCTINITSVDESDLIDIVSDGYFKNKSGTTLPSNYRDWFYSSTQNSSSGYFLSLPISVTPTKKDVGNWTINFSVDDGASVEFELIDVFVNFTESAVVLENITDREVYENVNFNVLAYDEDLRVRDYDVKDEALSLTSNTTWVSVGSGVTGSATNYTTFPISVDYTYVMSNGSLGVGNYSVLFNVTDSVGSVDGQVFVIQIKNESAPEWDASLASTVALNLTEGSAFSYNSSVNVSDEENDTITFYYEDVSGHLCSLNGVNFVSDGIISFTPTDCDVGFHNVNIIAGDGKLNTTKAFTFNISNIADNPLISSLDGENDTYDGSLSPGFNFIVKESQHINFSLLLRDDDFLIPASQQAAYYEENLSINVSFENSTGGFVDLFDFSFVEAGNPAGYNVLYEGSFIPGIADVGDYTVLVNVTDASGASATRTFYLNVTENLDPPVLDFISNKTLTIHDALNFTITAFDDEDNFTGLNLTYDIFGLDSGAPNLTVDSSGNINFDMGSNSSYNGIWRYNASVVDSDGMKDEQVFWIFVYGYATLVSPSNGSVFDLVENTSQVLNFSINHSVQDNLTWVFWVDDVDCAYQNNSDCSWDNLTYRENLTGLGDGNSYGWNFTPNYEDETYGLLKNLTVQVYPNNSNLTLNQRLSVATNFSFKFNISHANAPMRAVDGIVGTLEFSGSSGSIDMSNYFIDEDVDDSYYRQNVSFDDDSASAGIYFNHVYGNNWIGSVGLTSGYSPPYEGYVYVSGIDDYNSSDVSEKINVKFTKPSTTTSSSSSSKTVVKYYSIRVIVPDDVIISDDNYIDVPFSLENNGNIDLTGIDLASQVLYNNQFSDDVKIDLGNTYVQSLKVGEKRDYSMRIIANTDRAGRYKATLFANVTSPKLNDWGDFFIDLRKTNESEAEEMLVFTEKIVAENPECLELTEGIRRAREAFESGNEAEAIRLANAVSEACEDAISANEQVRYKVDGFVQENFYYILFLTLFVFVMGFVFYVWKRVKFNKFVEGDYISVEPERVSR